MKKSVLFIGMLLSAFLVLTSCESDKTAPSVTDEAAEAVESEVTEEADDGEKTDDDAKSETEGTEKQVKFVSGTTFSGSKIPEVVYGTTSLGTEPVDEAVSSRIIYSVNNSAAGKISGVAKQKSGTPTQTVTAKANLGYRFIGWSDGVQTAERSGDTEEGVYTALFDYEVLDMPIMVITTDNGKSVTSKTEYITGKVSVYGCEEEYVVESAEMKIRGRGNNSWGYPKKSYKMKLVEKDNLFGLSNGDEKVWCLLANQCDQSLLRNHISFELGRYFSAIEWQPASTSVEVYFNGEYIGVYLLAEDIKVSGDRVDVYDEEPDEIDTGYLLELSNYSEGDVINAGGRSYMIHSDLSEDNSIKKKQMKYIQDYVQECFDALKKGNEEKCLELIDIDSLVACYLTEEISKNLDSQWDSFYLYKDKGGKLCFGPMWDFDLAFGNANEGEEYYYDLFVGNGRGSGGGTTTWFALAMSCDWFRQLVVDKWNETYDSISLLPEFICDTAELGFSSFERNFQKWDIFGTSQNRETKFITSLETYGEHYQYLAEWTAQRIEWINSVFTNPEFVSDDEAMVTLGKYQANSTITGEYADTATKNLAESMKIITNKVDVDTLEAQHDIANEGPENLFDGEYTTKYCTNVNRKLPVEFEMEEACKVDAYLLRTANDTESYSERNPDSWKLYGSNDGKSWTVVDTVANGQDSLGATNYIWYGFECDSPDTYKYYKFIFAENGIIQFSEICLLTSKD